MKNMLMTLIDSLPPHEGKTFEEALADHLIANDVIVPPTKVYCIVDKGTKFAMVMPKSVNGLSLYELKDLSKYGYYTSQEEAEKHLK